MTNLKSLIQDQLYNTPDAWLTVAQLVALIPQAQGRDATVARALRRLRAEGYLTAQAVPGDSRRRQWTCSSPSSRIAVRALKQAKNAPQAQKRKGSMTTFQTAVESVVNEFVTAQKTFSAFEVTKELRDRSNAGTAVIDKTETGSVHVGGNDVPRIEHDQVKLAVLDLFAQGKMPGYDRSNNSGQYWQYGPVAAPITSGNNGSPPPVAGGNYDGSSSL